VIGGQGSDLLFGTLSEDLIFTSYGSLVLAGGLVQDIQIDLQDPLAAAMLDQFTVEPESDEEEIASLLEGLPGYSTVLPDSLDGLVAPEPLLDASLFQRVFKLGAFSRPVQFPDDILFQQQFDSNAVTVPAVPIRDGILQPADEDDSAAPVGDETDAATEELPVPAPALPPPASGAADRRGGELFVAALGLAGLQAARPPQSHRRRPPDWEVLAGAAGRVASRTRKALDSITRA
jgi:hypothetical protein